MYGERARMALKESRYSGLILLCLFSVLGLNLVFAVRNSILLWFLPVSLPLTLILGISLFYFSACVHKLQGRLAEGLGTLNLAFLLFFLFLLGFVGLYFMILALPLEMLLKSFATPSFGVDYRRWSLDLAAVHSLMFWVWTVSRRN